MSRKKFTYTAPIRPDDVSIEVWNRATGYYCFKEVYENCEWPPHFCEDPCPEPPIKGYPCIFELEVDTEVRCGDPHVTLNWNTDNVGRRIFGTKKHIETVRELLGGNNQYYDIDDPNFNWDDFDLDDSDIVLGGPDDISDEDAKNAYRIWALEAISDKRSLFLREGPIIELLASGYHSPNTDTHIKRDGVRVGSIFRGWNVAIFDGVTGELKDFKRFDTWHRTNGRANVISLIEMLNNVSEGDFIAIVTHDEPQDHTYPDLREEGGVLDKLGFEKVRGWDVGWSNRCCWLGVVQKGGEVLAEMFDRGPDRYVATAVLLPISGCPEEGGTIEVRETGNGWVAFEIGLFKQPTSFDVLLFEIYLAGEYIHLVEMLPTDLDYEFKDGKYIASFSIQGFLPSVKYTAVGYALHKGLWYPLMADAGIKAYEDDVEYDPEKDYDVRVTPDPLVGGGVTGGGSYNSGDIVTIGVELNDYYDFLYWKELVPAEDIANNWINYPDHVGQWQLVKVGGDNVVRSTVNTRWTGFWRPDNLTDFDFTFKAGVTVNQDDDWVGFTFAMTKKEGEESPYEGSDAYSFYFFALNGFRPGDRPRHSGLYKMVNAPWIMQTQDHKTWTGEWIIGENKWNDQVTYFTQYSSNLPQQVNSGSEPSNTVGKLIPLQRTNTYDLTWNFVQYQSDWQDIRIKREGDNIKVWVNNILEIDYIDNDDPLGAGGYGPFTASQSHGSFKNLSLVLSNNPEMTFTALGDRDITAVFKRNNNCNTEVEFEIEDDRSCEFEWVVFFPDAPDGTGYKEITTITGTKYELPYGAVPADVESEVCITDKGLMCCSPIPPTPVFCCPPLFHVCIYDIDMESIGEACMSNVVHLKWKRPKKIKVYGTWYCIDIAKRLMCNTTYEFIRSEFIRWEEDWPPEGVPESLWPPKPPECDIVLNSPGYPGGVPDKYLRGSLRIYEKGKSLWSAIKSYVEMVSNTAYAPEITEHPVYGELYNETWLHNFYIKYGTFNLFVDGVFWKSTTNTRITLEGLAIQQTFDIEVRMSANDSWGVYRSADLGFEASDIELINNHLDGSAVFDELQVWKYDANKDGEVTEDDRNFIADYIAGTIDRLPGDGAVGRIIPGTKCSVTVETGGSDCREEGIADESCIIEMDDFEEWTLVYLYAFIYWRPFEIQWYAFDTEWLPFDIKTKDQRFSWDFYNFRWGQVQFNVDILPLLIKWLPIKIRWVDCEPSPKRPCSFDLYFNNNFVMNTRNKERTFSNLLPSKEYSIGVTLRDEFGFETWCKCEIKERTEPDNWYTLVTEASEGGEVFPLPDFCPIPYYEGEEVKIAASPLIGYAFSHWEGDISLSEDKGKIVMDSDKTIKAVFVARKYILIIEAVGQGSVTPTYGEYYAGDVIDIKAIPIEGYYFHKWEGPVVNSSDMETELIMPAGDVKMVAIFVEGTVETNDVVYRHRVEFTSMGWGYFQNNDNNIKHHIKYDGVKLLGWSNATMINALGGNIIRGIHLLVLDSNGDFKSIDTYDTHLSANNAQLLADKIGSCNNGDYLVFATYDNPCVNNHTWETLRAPGKPLYGLGFRLLDWSYRCAWAGIAQKGHGVLYEDYNNGNEAGGFENGSIIYEYGFDVFAEVEPCYNNFRAVSIGSTTAELRWNKTRVYGHPSWISEVRNVLGTNRYLYRTAYKALNDSPEFEGGGHASLAKGLIKRWDIILGNNNESHIPDRYRNRSRRIHGNLSQVKNNALVYRSTIREDFEVYLDDDKVGSVRNGNTFALKNLEPFTSYVARLTSKRGLADNIYNWSLYPSNFGKWAHRDSLGEIVLVSDVNTSWSGIWDSKADLSDLDISFKMGCLPDSGDNDWIGFTFSMKQYSAGNPDNPYSGAHDAYSFYFFALNGAGDGTARPRHSGLYKMIKAPYPNDLSVIAAHQTWTGNWITTPNTWNDHRTYFTQTGSNLPEHNHALEQPANTKGMLIPLQRTNTFDLTWKSVSNFGLYSDIRVKREDNNIKVWVNDKLEINYTDGDEPLGSGGYGPFSASQRHAIFRSNDEYRIDCSVAFTTTGDVDVEYAEGEVRFIDGGFNWVEWEIYRLSRPANSYLSFKLIIHDFYDNYVGEFTWSDASDADFTRYKVSGLSKDMIYKAQGFAVRKKG